MIESVSRRAFSSSSGTYNVRASELARESKLNVFSVTVFFLDDTHHSFQIEKKAKGSVLLEQVFHHLDLIEKDYFGLQTTENGAVPSATNTEITQWLDSGKSVKKQISNNSQFWLAVRFYPPEPSRLAEEYTRYLLCLQLRKLLLDGRMSAPKNTMLLLASFTVQAELGDYNEKETDYSALRLLPAPLTPEDGARLRELHRLHRGQAPADAEGNFLDHAKRLHCYGVEKHPAKDYNNIDILIGVTSIGIVVFQNNVRVNTFSWGKIVKISFKRKQFFIQLKREPSESYDTVLGFNMRSGRAAKALWRCSVERHGFFRLRAPKKRPLLGALGALAGIGAPRVSRTESQALEDARRSRSSNRTFVRRSTSLNRDKSPALPTPAAPRGARVTDVEPAPRPAWSDAPPPPDDDGGFLERALRVPLPYADDSEPDAADADDAPVAVRVPPGPDGKFGFNVRGGRGQPVLVSRVAPHSPADLARPHLQEGDQVISINGVYLDELSHEQVVALIRNTKGVLTMVLKPNAVYETSAPQEPAVCFVPLGALTPRDDAEQALWLLGDGLASGAALAQYEALPRRSDDAAAAARRARDKNRYRDIAPYDKNRVILKNGPNGDYINASYINLEIPGTDDVLTYIATQGPLPSTVGDFWQMVWESESSLVVMLTVLVERGRAKCHQYWPRVGAPPLKVTDELTVSTGAEENFGHYIRREMCLKESSGASRNITQLQYTAWPDHGVPDDHAAFTRFTQLVTSLRGHRAAIPSSPEADAGAEADGEAGAETRLAPPVVVHCSAGVGRTGALALSEAALAVLRARRPLYPLELVRALRLQRALCVQTQNQYKFVCESIQMAYAQGLVGEDDPK